MSSFYLADDKLCIFNQLTSAPFLFVLFMNGWWKIWEKKEDICKAHERMVSGFPDIGRANFYHSPGWETKCWFSFSNKWKTIFQDLTHCSFQKSVSKENIARKSLFDNQCQKENFLCTINNFSLNTKLKIINEWDPLD